MPEDALQIVEATPADVDAVHGIESASFPAPWRREFFASEVVGLSRFNIVAKKDGVIVGQTHHDDGDGHQADEHRRERREGGEGEAEQRRRREHGAHAPGADGEHVPAHSRISFPSSADL